MKNCKRKSSFLMIALVGLTMLMACAGCTDPPLRTGPTQPMDNKAKPAAKQEQGGKMQPQGVNVSE